jgi:amino acid adenylation domain-containing protein
MEKSATLSPIKQTLLAQRLKGISAAKDTLTERIARRSSRDSAPLSFAQQQMWVIDQMTPGNPAYNLPYGFHVRGPLDITALEQSFNEVIKRHEILRTTFAAADAEPVQLIHPELKLELNLTALDHLPVEERENKLQDLASEEATKSFELQRLPLIRVSVFKLAEAEHVLIVNLHHIVGDGLSIGLLLNELDRFYRGFTAGDEPRAPELAIQYADFALWQRCTLANEAAYRTQIEFWQKQLGGTIPVLELPTDQARPPFQSFHGSNVFFNIAAAQAQNLTCLGRREGATFFMTLLAAFQVLLQRYSGADDLVIGTPLAARNPRDVQSLIGNFLNMVALRCDLSGDPTFVELLRRTRATVLDAFSNSDLPFEAMMKHLRFERDPSRNPIFQVVLQVLPTSVPQLGDLEVSNFYFDLKFAQFDLSVQLYEEAGGYRGRFEYCSDLFKPQTIRRMCAHYGTLLQAIAHDPNQKISALPMLTESERRQAISGWNTNVSYPKGRCLHERFEKQVELTPDAVAVVCEEQRLSYAELNRRANQLAHRLCALGVTPDQLVGLRTDRSIEMVIGIVGILKAGGAYLPLDPACPKDRVAFMLEDSGVKVVVTQTSLAADFKGIPSTCVFLEEQPSGNDTNPSSVTTADNLAYVIYTSGSTGKPKGALVTHYNVTRLFDATDDWYHFNQHDVWSLFHSCAFDFSVWELWGALLYGGRVVVVPYWVSRSPEAFRELLVREHVTVLNQTPSAFRQLIQADLALPKADFAMRYVIFGGEALELQSLRPWFERYGDAHPLLVNMYGITETTVHVTYRPICVDDLRLEQGSVIGMPIPDLQVYILDPNGEPVPIGVPGEMYVGGAGVARGYLNRPELSAKRFISDPFSGWAGTSRATMYRTGDLARRLEDGDIEYLGRIDEQVKIRGYRIEPAEIEAAIAGHSAVRDVAVVAREDEPGDHRLVAYLVAENAPSELAEQLRTLIRASMPEYMVPAHFVIVEALPLTSNGKLDRKALPPPDFGGAARRNRAVAARTPAEEMVMDIFRGVLKRTDFGVFDNFFDLGGHSLMAARLMSGLRSASGVDVALRELFARPTVAGLAETIDALRWLQNSTSSTCNGSIREEIVL